MTGKKRNPLIYELCVLLCCIFCGVGNPLVKVGGETLTPFLYTTIRFSVALALFLLFCGRRIVLAARTTPFFPVFLISFFNGVAYLIGNVGLFFAKATVASFLMSLSVLFTPFIGLLVLKTRIRPSLFPVIALAVAGLYMVCGNADGFSFGLGELMALSCSALLALSMVFTTKYGAGLDLAYLAAAQCLAALLLSLPVFLLTETWIPLASYPPQAVLSLLFTAVFCSCLVFLLQNLALRHISPTLVALTFLLDPVFTVIASRILIDERLTVSGMIGGALILCGVTLATLIQNGVFSKKTGKEDVPDHV